MVTTRQSQRLPFDAAPRFTIEEYHRLVEEGILEERPRSVDLLDGPDRPYVPDRTQAPTDRERVASRLYSAGRRALQDRPGFAVADP